MQFSIWLIPKFIFTIYIHENHAKQIKSKHYRKIWKTLVEIYAKKTTKCKNSSFWLHMDFIWKNSLANPLAHKSSWMKLVKAVK